MFFREKGELVLVLLVLALVPLHARPKPAPWPSGQKVRLELSRGGFEILRYRAQLDDPSASPKALIIFGTGCSGWSYWEERVCCKLQSSGYEVLGLDFARYSQFDYDLNNLEGDYQKIAQFGTQPYGNHPLPVILGGWSTGAEQAVAVAGGPHPPSGLAGLLLVSPGSEGGYGPYATNYITWEAPASKLFQLTNFDARLRNIRIAQWHAELDPLDSRAWLSSLSTPHREFDFDDAIHDYRGACDDFLTRLNDSVSWILKGSLPDPKKIQSLTSKSFAGTSSIGSGLKIP